MRQRGDLPRRSVRPARHDGAPALVEPVGEEPAKLGRRTRETAQEADEPEQHRAADDISGERRAETGRPRRQQRALEGRLIVVADRLACEIAETRRDAVGGDPGLEMPKQRVAALADVTRGGFSLTAIGSPSSTIRR